jgi:hypothetical protein
LGGDSAGFVGTTTGGNCKAIPAGKADELNKAHKSGNSGILHEYFFYDLKKVEEKPYRKS